MSRALVLALAGLVLGGCSGAAGSVDLGTPAVAPGDAESGDGVPTSTTTTTTTTTPSPAPDASPPSTGAGADAGPDAGAGPQPGTPPPLGEGGLEAWQQEYEGLAADAGITDGAPIETTLGLPGNGIVPLDGGRFEDCYVVLFADGTESAPICAVVLP